MSRLIGSELFKLRKRGLPWILLGILCGIIILLHLLLFAISRLTFPGQSPTGSADLQTLLGLPVAIPFGLSILGPFGALLSVILLASSMGNEYGWRTIRIALISSESRLRFLSAKLVSVLIMILIGMVASLVTGFIMSIITTLLGGNALNFSFLTGSYLWSEFLQFWRTLFIILPSIFLGFLFAVLGRSAIAGIAVGIGISIAEGIITPFMRLAGGWVSNVPDYLFTANINAITSLNDLPGRFFGGGGGGGGFGNLTQLPSVAHASIVLSVYIVIFLVLTFYLFHKRDVTG